MQDGPERVRAAMTIQSAIERKLHQALAPVHLEVINESGNHSVPPGSESHFKLVIASQAFAGETAVKRHRRVYAILQQELDAGVHALAIHAYTPEEWQARAAPAPESPACRGGSKHDH